MTPAANSHPTADGPRFARWLVGAANNAGITTQSGLRSAWAEAYPGERVPSTGEVSGWWTGSRTPVPATISRLAKLLRADRDQALAAAGYASDAPDPAPRARQWSDWVVRTADTAGQSPETIIEASEGTLDAATLDDWWAARATPTPTAAVLAARILGADPFEPGGALDAAGHGDLARQIRAIQLLADPAVRALDTLDIPDAVRRTLIREYEANKAHGVGQAEQILRLKAAAAAKPSATDRDAL